MSTFVRRSLICPVAGTAIAPAIPSAQTSLVTRHTLVVAVVHVLASRTGATVTNSGT